MKVILLKDVAKIGRRFDVVNVPDGFAMNKLIPKNLAQAATGENMKRLKDVSERISKEREESGARFGEFLSKIKDTPVVVKAEANAEGRLFQAIKPLALAMAIEKATGYAITPEQIITHAPIKSVGSHEIDVASGEAHGTVSIVVER